MSKKSMVATARDMKRLSQEAKSLLRVLRDLGKQLASTRAGLSAVSDLPVLVEQASRLREMTHSGLEACKAMSDPNCLEEAVSTVLGLESVLHQVRDALEKLPAPGRVGAVADEAGRLSRAMGKAAEKWDAMPCGVDVKDVADQAGRISGCLEYAAELWEQRVPSDTDLSDVAEQAERLAAAGE